jgi:hypothetical protein
MDELKEVIAKICEDALQGRITLDDFYGRWPVEADQFEPLRVIFKDLEDGITHTPGMIFSKEIDMMAWEKSDSYKKIDRHLLDLKNS